MGVTFKVDIDGPLAELDRLVAGPDLSAFEMAMSDGLAATFEKVHQLTGHLKTTGRGTTELGEGSWEGTMAFARHPGIFELARGDRPTRNHPEGGHYFFDPGGEMYLEAVKRALIAYVTSGEDEGGGE
jgi:hypothetical protein